MLRLTMIQAALFFAPFLAYGLYLVFLRRPVTAGASWREAPILWLVAVGALLTVVAFVVLAWHDTGPLPSSGYVPPSFKDGHFVPGHVQ